MTNPHKARDSKEERKRDLKILEEETKRDRFKEVLKKLLHTPDGREFYWNIMESCGLYDLGFTGNSREYYKIGQRHIAIMLSDMAESASYELFMQMRKENKGREQ